MARVKFNISLKSLKSLSESHEVRKKSLKCGKSVYFKFSCLPLDCATITKSTTNNCLLYSKVKTN